MLKSSENSATIIKSKGMAKDMTYQTCINVIARVKGNEYLENLIKGARELSEFNIVDPYDEIHWKERMLMPLLRKEAKEALGIELPMNIRVIRMRIRKRKEADYILHPEKYMRMPDGHLWRVKVKKPLHYRLERYSLIELNKSSCEDLYFQSQKEAEDYWRSFCEERMLEAARSSSAYDIQKIDRVLEIRQPGQEFLGYRLEQL